MTRIRAVVLVMLWSASLTACAAPARDGTATGADPALTAFIDKIRAVDNHGHPNTVAPADTDSDALPLDGIPLELPVGLGPANPGWVAASKAMYQYPYSDRSDAHLAELRTTVQRVAKERGENFPVWVLDQLGTEVYLANRVALGPGVAAPRFRWVSFGDPLMLPLSTKAEAAVTPDRQKLYPLEDKLLKRYLADLRLTALPATLDQYLATVVVPTLEAQQKAGCVGIKFEAAYLRSLDFAEVPAATAARVYAANVRGGEPSRADYKALQDFLFRAIAREAGRLGMPVQIHSFEGFGNSYSIAGSDPLLLESAIDDPALAKTNFIIVHGGGVYADRTGALLGKPNVWADFSLMTTAYPPARLAGILRSWLTQFPGKVLFGSDAAAFGPDLGWELVAWVGTRNGRDALALALTEMLRGGEVSRARAEEIATMVMRTNAAQLYRLDLK
jgi:predicted TIM-barrel fold metal-dependent hydrolase